MKDAVDTAAARANGAPCALALCALALGSMVLSVPSCGRINYDSTGADDASLSPIDSGVVDSGEDASATPEVVDTGGFPFKLAADESNIYWADNETGSLHRLPFSGGPSVELVPPRASASVFGLSVTDGVAYLCDSATGEIRSVPTSGGTVSLIATSPCFDLVATDTHLYWSSRSSAVPTIRRLALPNGVPENVGLPGPAANLKIVGANLYWTSYAAGEVHVLPTMGGASNRLASVANGGPWGLAVDGQYVYFVEHRATDGAVSRVPVAGGPSEVVAGAQAGAHQIVLDGDTIYWTSEFDGTVMRKRPNSEPVAIAEGQDSPLGLTLGGDAVYWTDRAGQVLKVAK